MIPVIPWSKLWARLGLGLLVALFVLAPAPWALLPHLLQPALAASVEQAVLAGGCFWCLEHDLGKLPGVLNVQSGYSGGHRARPTYSQVSSGLTGHQESVQVRFDPARISYATLLRSYWRNVDPLDGDGQFCDRGSSYRPVIFVANAEQARQAEASRVAAARELGRSLRDLKVAIRPRAPFWPAEEYHQDYAKRNSIKYAYYRWACGRDRRLDLVWGDSARTPRPWLGSDS